MLVLGICGCSEKPVRSCDADRSALASIELTRREVRRVTPSLSIPRDDSRVSRALSDLSTFSLFLDRFPGRGAPKLSLKVAGTGVVAPLGRPGCMELLLRSDFLLADFFDPVKGSALRRYENLHTVYMLVSLLTVTANTSRGCLAELGDLPGSRISSICKISSAGSRKFGGRPVPCRGLRAVCFSC